MSAISSMVSQLLSGDVANELHQRILAAQAQSMDKTAIEVGVVEV